MCARQDKYQKDLAAHLKMTGTYLSKQLHDNNPKHLSRMAEFFGTSVSEFVKAGEE